MFDGLKIEELDLNFNTTGFGPAEKTHNFGDQFDGKLFKPYNKKDKLGRLCEFVLTSAGQPQVQIAAAVKLGNKQTAAESQLMDEAEDTFFEEVAEKVKKEKPGAQGQYVKRPVQSKANRDKILDQRVEDA